MENHILASEVIMGKLYDYFKYQGTVLRESKDEWVAAGLLHDVILFLFLILKNC